MSKETGTNLLVPREIFGSIANHLDQPEITLITGSRQVGKTVLLAQLKQYLSERAGVPGSRIFSYNLDLVHDQEALRDQGAFIQFLRDRSQEERIFVFVDEAQKVSEAPRFFKGVYDSNLNVKMILTGSASLEAKAHFKETLAGRKRIFVLAPFSFNEFLRSRDAVLADMLAKEQNGEEINPIDLTTIRGLYKEYMRFGGYPRVALAENFDEKISVLKEIYSSYVEKDAIGFWGIQHPPAFNKLLKLLAAQIGQLVNINELAMNLGVDRQTVERYINLLEETFIIKNVTPFFRNSRQEIIKSGKAYFLDTGIRNIALDNVSDFDARTDQGQLFENAVFIELERLHQRSGGQLHFWRTKQKAEVDFVMEKSETAIPIEAKYSIRKDALPRGLRSFIQAFKPEKAILVTLKERAAPRKIASVELLTEYPFTLSAL